MITRKLESGDALPPADSPRALDWLNFFLAALLMGSGPFVTVYLADRGWTPESIGLVLTASGLGVVPIRAGFFAFTADPAPLVLIQVLDGLTGATLGVLTTLVVADLTKGTGRFNLSLGLVGTLSGVGASLSTSISGVVVERFGHTAGFVGAMTVALLAVAILWTFMPETKPAAVPAVS